MSTPSGLLDIATLHAVSDAAVSAGLSRDALLAHLSDFSAVLRQASKPNEQILLDVSSLANVKTIEDEPVPIRVWLETAAHLSGPLPQAKIFRHALTLLPPPDLRPRPSSWAHGAHRAERFAGRLALVFVALLGAASLGWRWFMPQSSSSSPQNTVSASALPSGSLVPTAVVNVVTPPATVPAIASSAPSTAVPAMISAAPSSPRVEPPKSPTGAAVPTRTSSAPTSTRYTDGVLKGN